MPQKWIDIILGKRDFFRNLRYCFCRSDPQNLPCHQRFEPTIAKDDQVYDSKILGVLENLKEKIVDLESYML